VIRLASSLLCFDEKYIDLSTYFFVLALNDLLNVDGGGEFARWWRRRRLITVAFTKGRLV
jgi:hypothetical protein